MIEKVVLTVLSFAEHDTIARSAGDNEEGPIDDLGFSGWRSCSAEH